VLANADEQVSVAAERAVVPVIFRCGPLDRIAPF